MMIGSLLLRPTRRLLAMRVLSKVNPAPSPSAPQERVRGVSTRQLDFRTKR
jgi:hypothetical protein